MKKYKSRNDVPEKYKWDLTDFFKDEREMLNSLDETNKLIEKLNTYKGCTKDAKKLYEFLELDTKTSAMVENIYVYNYLINDQELGNPNSITNKNKAIKLYGALSESTNFFAPELLKLDKKEYDNLFESYNKLNEYKPLLDRIYRNKEHVLSEKEETIISKLVNAMDNYSDISSNLLNSEHDYGTIKIDDELETIATNNYRILMKNKNRATRKKIYKQFNKTLDQYAGTSAALLNSYVNKEEELAKIYNFSDAWNKKLFNLNFDNLVFSTLVESVLGSSSAVNKYYKLKKKVLKLKDLSNYDLSLDLVSSNKEYSIEDGISLIKEALVPLGNDYLEKLNKIFDNHYIDYCQYKGKCSGGYSFSTSTNPSRILLSYNGELDSVSTIIHEAGHNVHHQYLMENNHLAYRDQSSIVCEVASLTNEVLLSNYLANNGKTKEEKLAGINNMLDVIMSNLFGAVREGYMEQKMHDEVVKGGSLTKDYLDNLTKESFKDYYADVVKMDDSVKNSWITRSHYYMNYYLYSYAISISVAINVALKILNNEDDMINKYKEFLSAGSDVWPIDAFKILGVDLTDKSVYLNAIEYFESLIDEFEKIYDSKEV